jgi:CheY-like chemotaxis protein
MRRGKVSIRVLLIEDNLGDATLIKGLLGDCREDFNVTRVASLAEAKESLLGQYMDVILLDLGLPDGRGLDTLTQALEFSEAAPIVVLTGSKAESIGTEAVRMGAQDYLVKGDSTADAIERSILYAVERKKAQESIKNALQSNADLVRGIPSGLLTFQYEWPGRLSLLSWNPRGEEMLGDDPGLEAGMELDRLWPLNCVAKEQLLNVVLSGDPYTLKNGRFEKNGEVVSMDLRAFRIPCQRLCVSLDDVTDRVREEELRIKAYRQIALNIEHFASLVDELRNPNSVIIGVAEGLDSKASRCILTQAERIESIINRLDEQWIASENIRHFLWRSLTMPPPCN